MHEGRERERDPPSMYMHVAGFYFHLSNTSHTTPLGYQCALAPVGFKHFSHGSQISSTKTTKIILTCTYMYIHAPARRAWSSQPDVTAKPHPQVYKLTCLLYTIIVSSHREQNPASDRAPLSQTLHLKSKSRNAYLALYSYKICYNYNNPNRVHIHFKLL